MTINRRTNKIIAVGERNTINAIARTEEITEREEGIFTSRKNN
jgi:hypothetical protein